MKPGHILIFSLLFWFFPKTTNAQISIANTSSVIENFDAIGSSANATLPVNWKISPAGAAAPTWNDAGNFASTTLAASNGSPVTGGRYNWSKTGDVDRSLG